MDALAAVLEVAGVHGTVAATVNAADPWGLALDAVPGAAFHAITEGTAWLCAQASPGAHGGHRGGHNGPRGDPGLRLMPGDIVLLPAGTAPTPARAPRARTQAF